MKNSLSASIIFSLLIRYKIYMREGFQDLAHIQQIYPILNK
jgi:hypothetical protein